MSKHLDRPIERDRDLDQNPLIGGSKGVNMAGVTPDELDELLGENTIEGDIENATNADGGIDKPGREAAMRHNRHR
jgi:hypothetical protein